MSGFLGVALLIAGQPVVGVPLTPELFGYPRSPRLVTAGEKQQLQALLDAHKVIRLENADYSDGGPASITVRSGCEIYGLPDTILPRIEVEGGSEGVVINGVKTSELYFPASASVTRNNVFSRITGPVTVQGGTLEDNLFLSLNYAKISVDTRASGHLRNNRFIRVRVQGEWPQLRMLGDLERRSHGNVFVAFSALTPHGNAVEVSGQGDLGFVGFDCEQWNYSNLSTKALMTTGRMGTLRILGIAGTNTRYPTGIFDVSADEFVLLDSAISTGASPAVMLRSPVLRALTCNTYQYVLANEPPPPFRYQAFQKNLDGSRVDGVPYAYGSALQPSQQSAISTIVSNPGRIGAPWGRPSLPPVPDPAGPDWKSGLSGKPDSTSYIQGLINSQGFAFLPAGTYYISSPLKLASSQGLMGEGADRTVIIAKSNTFDMITFTDKVAGSTRAVRMNLCDLTIQGGRNGIVTDKAGSGDRAQYTDFWLSHVTIREMAGAGILVDRIYGWDNSFIDYVNIVNCGKGLQQAPDPAYSGGDMAGMCYIDKVVFYGCQFIGNGLAFDLPARRPNNRNVWLNCRFENNTSAAFKMVNNNTPMLLNSEFVNNGGTASLPTIGTTGAVSIASCYFEPGAQGKALLGASQAVTVEGSHFEGAGSSGATILGTTKDVFIYNSKAIGLPLGAINSGVLLNNNLGGSPASLSSRAVEVRAGLVYTLVAGQSAPEPQFLFGAASVGPVPFVPSPPEVLVPVMDKTVVSGDFAILSVSVAADPAPSYQWSLDGEELPDETASLLVIPVATPTSEGHYTVVASNEAGSVASGPARLTVQVLFSEWAAQFENPAAADAGADLNSNGLPNLLDYLFAINPVAQPGAEDAAAMARSGLESNGGAEYLTLTYRKNARAIGLDLQLEKNSELSANGWMPVEPDVVEDAGSDPATGNRWITLKVDVTGQPRGFLRLNVRNAP